jgi:hypothetical protein
VRRFVALWAAVALGLVGGCGTFWNKGSQALDVNPLAIGSGAPVVTPANDNRFWNGEPMDLRTK